MNRKITENMVHRCCWDCIDKETDCEGLGCVNIRVRDYDDAFLDSFPCSDYKRGTCLVCAEFKPESQTD